MPIRAVGDRQHRFVVGFDCADAADALAVAICHAWTAGVGSRMAKALEAAR